jgi:hypothetical protein
MKINISQLQLHTPLFLGRTNLGDKLKTSERAGLAISYNEGDQFVKIQFNGENGLIPLSSVAAIIPETNVIAMPKKTGAIKQPVNAQVSSPTGHVFEGPGKGQK